MPETESFGPFGFTGTKYGGKVCGFTYSRSLGELIGTWTAEIANIPKESMPTAGDDFDMDGVMTNGFIEKIWTDPDGMTHLTGKDAGVRLMRTTPPAQSLPEGGPSAVIASLAGFCGLGSGGGSPSPGGGGNHEGSGGGYNIRSAVTGTTCAEAIVEMAMLDGKVAYIGNDGGLNVVTPKIGYAPASTVLDDSGSEIDLDGYASQVSVILTRRKKTIAEEEVSAPKWHFRGSTPGEAEEKTYSVNFGPGSGSVTIIEPLGVLKSSTTSITEDGIEITTVENHNIEVKTQVVLRGGTQYYRLFAWAETGYDITKTVTGSYTTRTGNQANFTEITEETMTRNIDNVDAPWIEYEWKGKNLGRVTREVVKRTVDRQGGKALEANMPSYSPPGENGENIDTKIERDYIYTDFGLGVICREVETKYEARQIGQISKLKKKNPQTGEEEPVTVFDGVKFLALTSHTTPVWMPIKTKRMTYEKYKKDGTCEFSASTEWCDEGAPWMLANGLPPTGDENVDEYQEAYAKFNQRASGLSVNIGGGGTTSIWQFMELPGMELVWDSEEGVNVNSKNWYNNGTYVPSPICPHYEASSRDCGIYGISAIGDFIGEDCPCRGRNWQSCVRAQAALEQARNEEDRPLLEPPVIGIAGSGVDSFTVYAGNGKSLNIGRPAAGYQREIYLDDEMDEGTAQNLANTFAQNILNIKQLKGIRKTIVIPYSPSVVPNGAVVSVSHDWANMQTTVSYIVEGSLPEVAQLSVPATAAGLADGVSGRNAGRRTRPMSGTVKAIEGGIVYVDVNGMIYKCSSKLVNIGVGDSVLVSFSSGNSMHGHIVERM